jgi:hypothetical protein
MVVSTAPAVCVIAVTQVVDWDKVISLAYSDRGAGNNAVGAELRIMKSAIAVTEPLSSISVPNRAPSKKSGKN